METLVLSATIGDSMWPYTIFLNTEILLYSIQMVAHSIATELRGKVWEKIIEQRFIKAEYELTVEVRGDSFLRTYSLKIKVSNWENLKTDINWETNEIRMSIIKDLSYIVIWNSHFKM